MGSKINYTSPRWRQLASSVSITATLAASAVAAGATGPDGWGVPGGSGDVTASLEIVDQWPHMLEQVMVHGKLTVTGFDAVQATDPTAYDPAFHELGVTTYATKVGEVYAPKKWNGPVKLIDAWNNRRIARGTDFGILLDEPGDWDLTSIIRDKTGKFKIITTRHTVGNLDTIPAADTYVIDPDGIYDVPQAHDVANRYPVLTDLVGDVQAKTVPVRIILADDKTHVFGNWGYNSGAKVCPMIHIHRSGHGFQKPLLTHNGTDGGFRINGMDGYDMKIRLSGVKMLGSYDPLTDTEATAGYNDAFNFLEGTGHNGLFLYDCTIKNFNLGISLGLDPVKFDMFAADCKFEGLKGCAGLIDGGSAKQGRFILLGCDHLDPTEKNSWPVGGKQGWGWRLGHQYFNYVAQNTAMLHSGWQSYTAPKTVPAHQVFIRFNTKDGPVGAKGYYGMNQTETSAPFTVSPVNGAPSTLFNLVAECIRHRDLHETNRQALLTKCLGNTMRSIEVISGATRNAADIVDGYLTPIKYGTKIESYNHDPATNDTPNLVHHWTWNFRRNVRMNSGGTDIPYLVEVIAGLTATSGASIIHAPYMGAPYAGLEFVDAGIEHRHDGYVKGNDPIPPETRPALSYIDYDGGTVAFTLGETLDGLIITGIDGTTASGRLWLFGDSAYVDGDALTGNQGGAATALGSSQSTECTGFMFPTAGSQALGAGGAFWRDVDLFLRPIHDLAAADRDAGATQITVLGAPDAASVTVLGDPVKPGGNWINP